MSDELRALLVMLCAVNPAAVVLAARGRIDGREIAAITYASAGVLIVVGTTIANGVIEALDTTDASFQLAAGVVMLGMGVATLVWPGGAKTCTGTWRDGIFPLGFPLIFNPAVAAGTIHYGATDGIFGGAAVSLIAAIAGVGAAWFAGARWPQAMDAGARLTAAALMILAVALVVDSIKSV
ncbi:MAG: hypothetical protein AB7T37_07820 [Dehalococcoidia bacterium]